MTGETTGQLALRDPDVRLMVRVREDEAGAFEELVEKNQHRLVAVLHHGRIALYLVYSFVTLLLLLVLVT